MAEAPKSHRTSGQCWLIWEDVIWRHLSVFFIVDKFWMKSISSRANDREEHIMGMEGGRSQGCGRSCGGKRDCSHSSKSSHKTISSRTCRKIVGFSTINTSANLFFLYQSKQGWLLAHSPLHTAPSWALRDSPGAAMSAVVAAASFPGTEGASHGITGRVAATYCAPLVHAARLEAPGDHYNLV